MCNRSDMLIAWLDHELPPNEAAELEQHLEACADCRSCLHAYKEVSKSIDAYCDAAVESGTRREPLPRWVPVLSVAAAAVALLLFFPSQRVERRPPQASVPVAAAASPGNIATSALAAAPYDLADSGKKPPAAILTKRPILKPHIVAPVQVQNANWMPVEPAIQIAIPADAMFAPGAVPQGVTFTAELSIAADGSAQQLRLRP
jgi:anti-sigma factor RsiW